HCTREDLVSPRAQHGFSLARQSRLGIPYYGYHARRDRRKADRRGIATRKDEAVMPVIRSPRPIRNRSQQAKKPIWRNPMPMTDLLNRRAAPLMAAAAALALFSGGAQAAWEPTRNVEFIVPAGTGGGADQMARMIQGIVAKHNLMKQTMVVINKA